MTKAVCRFEPEVVEAVMLGQWPGRTDDDLRAHVESCPACLEAVGLATAFEAESLALQAEAGRRLADGRLVWWRAQVRARQAARRAALQPIVAAVVVSLLVATLGITLAWYFYVKRIDLPARITKALDLVYTTVRHKYYVDELADRTAIRGTMKLTRAQKWIDENVIDGAVRLTGRSNKLGGAFAAWFDRVFIDGAVNAVALLSQVFGAAFRLVQTGRIQQYAAFAVGGALLTAAWLILS